jgi:hypothetical protein
MAQREPVAWIEDSAETDGQESATFSDSCGAAKCPYLIISSVVVRNDVVSSAARLKLQGSQRR